MNINITGEKIIETEMKEQLQEAIKSFREEVKGSVILSTQKHILEVNKCKTMI